jgi:maltooligosyltrehalose trehalohydrolase
MGKMKLVPLNKLGARETSPGVVDFGLLLPWVSAEQGSRLWVKLIHEKDQFLQEIQPMMFEMAHSKDPDYGDYWSVRIAIQPGSKPHPQSAWGSLGRYVYRFCLQNPNLKSAQTFPENMLDWIVDPFAREFGVGKLSAFTLGYKQHVWSEYEKAWKTPPLEDLMIYELMLNEFGEGVDGAIHHLDYLADLGVNCIELMPVSNVANEVDWGFLPIGYFGVDERFGKRKDLQRLIDAAHQKGMAVIVDSVYGHTSDSFPYFYVYNKLGYRQNPFMGPFAKDYFGESTDFHREFTRDFFLTVNNHWLSCYHVDGFRYDCVPNYWDGPLGEGYAALTYETYQMVKGKQNAVDHWQRFFHNGRINIIQCAEQLEAPKEILQQTYSNCTWQNETLDAAQKVAHGDQSQLVNLALCLGLFSFPSEVTSNDEVIRKTALQFIENHDHSRFVCNFGINTRGNELIGEGNRDQWYKVQPYLIGLFTAKGIPMLWQGQEFGENYYVPDQGLGRVVLFRPVRWDYFYDPVGKSTIALVRKLIKIRRERPQFRYGEHFFYDNYDRYQSKNVILFSRQYGSNFSLVALNFSDQEQTVPFNFPFNGDYVDELSGYNDLKGLTNEKECWLNVHSNFGRICTLKQEHDL